MRRSRYSNFNRLFHFLPIGVRQRYPRNWTTVQTIHTVESDESLDDAIFYSATSNLKIPSEHFKSELMPNEEPPIDYILVVSKKTLGNFENMKKIHNFLNSLNDSGVNVNMDYGSFYSDVLFVKLNLTDASINRLTSLYKVDLSYTNHNYFPDNKPKFKFFQTELDLKDASSIVSRAPETILDIKPTRATKAERSMLLYTLMTKTWFDTNVNDYGIEKMLSRGLIKEAYPLHEGQFSWSKDGPLSDRQILAKYWANFLCIHKNQPLNLIERYFGTEVAMYFAYMDFYMKYMFPAGLIGLLFYLLGLTTANLTSYGIIDEEVCNNNLTLCPMCNDISTCKYSNFSEHCAIMKTRAVLDNAFSAVFGIFMAIWAVFFMFFWKRRLNILRMRWNVFKVRLEKGIRPEFVEKAKRTRKNPATDVDEHYIPRYQRCLILTSTNFCVLFIALLLILFAMGVVVYQNRLSFYISHSEKKKTIENAKLLQKISTAIMILIQIFIFSVWQPKIAFYFTKLETPSTQYNFDNSFIIKLSILLFVNCYSAITYLTFIRGRAYEHPGAVQRYLLVREFSYDLCGPSGCFTDLGVVLGTIFFAASVKALLKQIFKPLISVFLRKRKHRKFTNELPQWELDFALLPTNKFMLFGEYIDIMVQYGYIVCFVAAFPLAPLFAVIRNALEIRIDAIKFLMLHRRYSPKKVRGLGPYNKILNWMTYIGLFVNGCVIAFSSSIISWLLYKFYFKTEGGYYKFMLSEFNTEELAEKSPDNSQTCFYPGIRHSPEDTNKYELKTEYYIILVVQLLFVIIYEQALIFLRALLRGSLHEKPKIVKERILHQDDLVKEARQKILDDLYKDTTYQKFSDKIVFPS